MARKKTRGSTKLLAGKRLSASDLQRLVTLTQARGVKVVDWNILGQPAPEAVRGTLQVGPARASKLLADLLRLRGLRARLEVFPLGIPVPHVYNVRISV